jgi:hypothetical protein
MSQNCNPPSKEFAYLCVLKATTHLCVLCASLSLREKINTLSNSLNLYVSNFNPPSKEFAYLFVLKATAHLCVLCASLSLREKINTLSKSLNLYVPNFNPPSKEFAYLFFLKATTRLCSKIHNSIDSYRYQNLCVLCASLFLREKINTPSKSPNLYVPNFNPPSKEFAYLVILKVTTHLL